MTYPAPHSLLTFGGTSWGGAETWQIGLRLANNEYPTPTQMDDFEAAYSIFHQAGGTKIDSGCKFQWMKFAIVDEEGHYPTDQDALIQEVLPAVTGSGTEKTFPQITLVVSLMTDRTRGLAHTGRFYPPPTCHPVDGTGRLPTAYQDAYATVAAQFISDINGVALGQVGVFSKVGEGMWHPVTHIRVGRVYDTQRRRRSSLPEEYLLKDVEPVP